MFKDSVRIDLAITVAEIIAISVFIKFKQTNKFDRID